MKGITPAGHRLRCFLAIATICSSVSYLFAQEMSGEHQGAEATESMESVGSLDVSQLLPSGFESMSLEDRRYLLYLYARVNQPRFAEALATKILADNPRDKQTLLVLASMYVERQDAKHALRLGRQLVDAYPEDHQSLYFLAAAYYLAGDYRLAAELFARIRDRFFPQQRYPYMSDLASSSFKSSDWSGAIRSYQELLDRHQVSEELRLQARKVLEGLYRSHLPRLRLDFDFQGLDSGESRRFETDYRQHVTDAVRLGASWGRGHVRVAERPSLLGRSYVTDEGWLEAEWVASSRWQGAAWLGGSEVGPLGGFRAARTLGDLRSLQVRFEGGRRSTDSLLMESLGGREHRVTLELDYPWSRNWLARAQLYGRQVLVGQEALGVSGGTLGYLERILLADSPEWRVGYRFNYMKFEAGESNPRLVDPAVVPGLDEGARAALVDQMVVPELNRHGIFMRLRNQLSGMLEYYVTAGADYAFERSSFEYQAEGGLSFYPRKSIEIRTAAGYSTSAGTADLNSRLWQFNIGLQYWF